MFDFSDFCWRLIYYKQLSVIILSPTRFDYISHFHNYEMNRLIFISRIHTTIHFNSVRNELILNRFLVFQDTVH